MWFDFKSRSWGKKGKLINKKKERVRERGRDTTGGESSALHLGKKHTRTNNVLTDIPSIDTGILLPDNSLITGYSLSDG